jgi:hypothetical protein
VPPGTETAGAATGSRTVCDLAGNCAQAGPISGNRVDKQGPSISLATSAAPTFLLRQAVAASYGSNDSGSGTAACSGPVASGGALDTASVGTKTFTVNACDAVGNQASQSVTYTVAYDLCVLYDQTRAHRAGSTVPSKLQICADGSLNASSPQIVVSATGLTKVDSSASASWKILATPVPTTTSATLRRSAVTSTICRP